MRFAIRSYGPADFQTLHSIDQRCYTPEIAYSREELRWYLGLPKADCLVAEMSVLQCNARTEIIGFILTASRKAHGHIITIDVLGPRRRLGVGTALLRKAESLLWRRGAREVWLETATDNDAAIAFWQRHGYRTISVVKNYYPGALDALAMFKPLAESALKENE